MGGTGSDATGECYALGVLMFPVIPADSVQVGSLEGRCFSCRTWDRPRCPSAVPTTASQSFGEKSEEQDRTDGEKG